MVRASAPKIAAKAATTPVAREEERDRRRHEQLARGRAGQRDRREEPAVAGPEAEDGELSASEQPTPAPREPKTATPASKVTTHAIGASSEGSWRTTTPGSSPENHETSARKPCQSGNA